MGLNRETRARKSGTHLRCHAEKHYYLEKAGLMISTVSQGSRIVVDSSEVKRAPRVHQRGFVGSKDPTSSAMKETIIVGDTLLARRFDFTKIVIKIWRFRPIKL